ncbi:choloylglycine hydrolase family protein [Francisellaceae bacterium CB300]
MKLKRKILSVALALSIPFSQGLACTTIALNGPDKHVVSGRTMEWGFDWDWKVLYIPKGTIHNLTAPKNLDLPNQSYTSKYSILGTGLAKDGEMLVIDGQNSQGLSLSANYLPGFTTYQDVTKDDKNYASIVESTMFVLSQFSTVQEAKEALAKYKVWADKSTMVDGVMPEVHFMITDKSGKGVVVEYIKGQVKFHDVDANVKVMTNSPTYDWHLTNLRNYLNLSNHTIQKMKIADDPEQTHSESMQNINGLGQGNGFLGLPGDYSPPSRFVKTAVIGYYANQDGPKNESTVSRIKHILNNVDIPKGAVAEKFDGKTMFDHTAYTVIKDQTDNKLYITAYDHPNTPAEIDLNKLNAENKKGFDVNISDLPFPNNDITSKL